MAAQRESYASASVGLFGLGVMGENLALNIERNGYGVAVYDREPERVGEVLARAAGKRIFGAKSAEEFIRAVERPRRIILLVKAGEAVDWSIAQIRPFLEAGDVIIDGGNSHFKDTARREDELRGAGLYFIGSGVSGGESGALLGPSLMPGGERAAYELIRPVWEAIAAKTVDGACVTYIGKGGAGHFVKMVHNGIEYGDMQLIAEAYDLMRRLLGMSAPEMAEVFDEWNRGELESYLVEITAKVLRAVDPDTGRPLVDLVLDRAGQKGTGRWASEAALELGVAVPTINAALDARNLSALKTERVAASHELPSPNSLPRIDQPKEIVERIRAALYASKICSYAQGMNLIRAGSEHWNWSIDLAEVARIWQGGCIIRAQFLGRIKDAYRRRPDLPSLLLDGDFRQWVGGAQQRWRSVVALALETGIPAPAMSASLGYYDLYRTASLPLNLTQAQRDFFGAHTYERIDRPEQGAVHTQWEKLLETTDAEG
ncbi:MAG TPA: NADP-dependent phosphogluconate dehydrogenase [Pyrinomonadaceae bacterium]|jgi:6-phosphogluconate dehydrogenase